jgi:hypothetical protein
MRGVYQLAIVTLALAVPQGAAAQAQFPPFVEIRAAKPPTVASGNGASFLVHELHVTNFQPVPLTLTRVEVLSGDADRRVLLALEDSALLRALSRPGVAPPLPFAERARVSGGLRAVVFFWVPLDGRTPPASVRHRLTIRRGPATAPARMCWRAGRRA